MILTNFANRKYEKVYAVGDGRNILISANEIFMHAEMKSIPVDPELREYHSQVAVP